MTVSERNLTDFKTRRLADAYPDFQSVISTTGFSRWLLSPIFDEHEINDINLRVKAG